MDYLVGISRHTKTYLSTYTRATDEVTLALNSSHSCSIPAVHSGSSRYKDETLSAKVFLISLSTRVSHFIRQDLLILHTRVSFVGFSKRQLQTTRW